MNRDFTAETWPCIPGDAWDEAYKEACDLAQPDTPLLILGTDRDDKVLSLARYHAREAGVQDAVQFSQRDFADLSSPRDYGCIITNPPYGERLGEREEVADLYRLIPDVLRRLPTWSHYIITSHPDFEKIIGQKADRRRKLYNGRIACTYFQFQGPRPPKVEDTTASATTGCDSLGEEEPMENEPSAVQAVFKSPNTRIACLWRTDGKSGRARATFPNPAFETCKTFADVIQHGRGSPATGSMSVTSPRSRWS